MWSSGAVSMRVYEEDLQEGWLYIVFDDEGRMILLDRDRWEALCRPSPEDQGH